jgi:predicted transcriptional regulator
MKQDADKSFAEIFEESKRSDVFWEELAILNFTNNVLDRLRVLGLTKKNLADMMQVSPAYVTKLMGGSNNFTLRTMAKIAHLLETELEVTLDDSAVGADKWFHHVSHACARNNEIPFHVANHEDLALAA